MTTIEHFADRLIYLIRHKCSFVVAGLDPRVDRFPPHLLKNAFQESGHTYKAVAEAIWSFNQAIVDAVAPFVVAVKPQIAFYELYGWEGLRIFTQTIQYARDKGLLVIADAKRSDIGSTAEAYADAFLGRAPLDDDIVVPIFDVDALTVNPYLGIDGVSPFIKAAKQYGKGIFVLVRTSNPSARDLQDLETSAGSVYQVVGRLVNRWGEGTEGREGYHLTGAVVGATYPDEAEKLRRIMPYSFFLVPGYGVQGGTAEDVAPCFNQDGLGAVVNASRSIIFAYRSAPWCEKYTEKEFAQAAAASAALMRDEINAAVARSCRLPW
jgi:orotidine-5'-phosphate decarboxylase